MTTVPDCGHFVEMEKPDALSKLAIDFLSRA
jgi:pimeloyl-ACP methyl ester carboxylesterase